MGGTPEPIPNSGYISIVGGKMFQLQGVVIGGARSSNSRGLPVTD